MSQPISKQAQKPAGQSRCSAPVKVLLHCDDGAQVVMDGEQGAAPTGGDAVETNPSLGLLQPATGGRGSSGGGGGGTCRSGT